MHGSDRFTPAAMIIHLDCRTPLLVFSSRGSGSGHPRFLGARKWVATAPRVALVAGFIQNQKIIRRRFGFRRKLNRHKGFCGY